MMAIRSLPAVFAGLICLGLAGCAGLSVGSNPQAARSAFRDPAMSMESASAAINADSSTQAEVLAALGPGTVVRFDSGFEIWVYRDRSPVTASSTSINPAELVILFTPLGLVKKMRIKPPY